MTADDARRLRADAERNRQRIVVAAGEAFGQNGLDVPMEEVARRAGVGIATLYRRFPTRPELIAAAFEAKMARYAEIAADALALEDAWLAFCGYVEQVCALQACDQGFMGVLTMTFPTCPAFEAQRARAYDAFTELMARAKASGRLRADFVAEDMVLVLMANAGVIEAMGDAAPDAWRRVVAYLLQAFEAGTARALPEPPAPRDVLRAMRRLHEGPAAPTT